MEFTTDCRFPSAAKAHELTAEHVQVTPRFSCYVVRNGVRSDHHDADDRSRGWPGAREVASVELVHAAWNPSFGKSRRNIQIFADPDLAQYAMSSVSNPAQLQSLLNFQMDALQVNLTQRKKARFDAVLQPVINNNFATGSGPAFIGMAADMRANGGYNAARVRLMRTLPKPVHFVWGTKDPYANRPVGEEIASVFPEPTSVALPLGHWLQIDSPADVARELLARN